MMNEKTWKIIEDEFVDILDKLQITAPNTGNMLIFDIDGYFKITDPYGKQLRKYKTLKWAIIYLLEND